MTDPSLDTQRTKVLDALLACFPERGKPGADAFLDEYGVVFSLVSREALGKLPTGKVSAIGIYASTTERKPQYPFVDVVLPVVLELHVAKEEGIPLAVTMERYLGVVERVVKANSKLGGLTADISVTGDNVDIDSPHDKQADGALYTDVLFSQRVDDPTQGRG